MLAKYAHMITLTIIEKSSMFTVKLRLHYSSATEMTTLTTSVIFGSSRQLFHSN